MSTDAQSRVDFGRARLIAFWRDVVAQLSGRSNRLLSWDEVCDKLRLGGLIYRGVQPVPVTQIIGSVGRYRDFDRAFLPSHDRTAGRWRSIDRAFYDEVNLPPVKLYKVGEAYFVLDGNHRVSVARQQGIAFVDAEVIEARSRVPVGPELNADDLEIQGEYAEFLERTHLDELRPDQAIRFTIGGGYARLLEHIAVHRYFQGNDWQRYFSEEEAVCDWYDNIYIPISRLIREQRILKDFPGRTEADLYLWIIEHQHYLREQLGPQVDTAAAAEHFAEHYTTHTVKRMLHALQDLVGAGDRADGEGGEDPMAGKQGRAEG